jgi:hypothetical protein
MNTVFLPRTVFCIFNVPGSNSSISKKPSPHLCKLHGLDTHTLALNKKDKETELNNCHVPSSLQGDDLANFLTYKEDEEEE